jgi:hypothetical protein
VDYNDLIVVVALMLITHIWRKCLASCQALDAMTSDDLKRVLRWTRFWSAVGGMILASTFWLVLLSGSGRRGLHQ